MRAALRYLAAPFLASVLVGAVGATGSIWFEHLLVNACR